MIKVSVIVPIYNAGEYLLPLLESLKSQTLKEIEFILVLDCPTDGSDKIAKEFAKDDNRFIIIENQHNTHIGNSRNRGIDIARGEYLAFADHDDYMLPNMYETLYNAAINQSIDIVISTPTLERQGEITHKDISELNTTGNKADHLLHDLLSYGGEKQDISDYCYIHNILYKKQIISNNGIRFVDTNHISNEDVIFNIEVLLHSPSVGYWEDGLYIHCLIGTSTSNTQYYYDWKKRFKMVERVYQLLCDTQTYERYKSSFFLLVQKKYMERLLTIILNKEGLKTFCQTFSYIRHTPYGKDAFTDYRDFRPRVWYKQLFRRIVAMALTL